MGKCSSAVTLASRQVNRLVVKRKLKHRDKCSPVTKSHEVTRSRMESCGVKLVSDSEWLQRLQVFRFNFRLLKGSFTKRLSVGGDLQMKLSINRLSLNFVEATFRWDPHQVYMYLSAECDFRSENFLTNATIEFLLEILYWRLSTRDCRCRKWFCPVASRKRSFLWITSCDLEVPSQFQRKRLVEKA